MRTRCLVSLVTVAMIAGCATKPSRIVPLGEPSINAEGQKRQTVTVSVRKDLDASKPEMFSDLGQRNFRAAIDGREATGLTVSPGTRNVTGRRFTTVLMVDMSSRDRATQQRIARLVSNVANFVFTERVVLLTTYPQASKQDPKLIQTGVHVDVGDPVAMSDRFKQRLGALKSRPEAAPVTLLRTALTSKTVREGFAGTTPVYLSIIAKPSNEGMNALASLKVPSLYVLSAFKGPQDEALQTLCREVPGSEYIDATAEAPPRIIKQLEPRLHRANSTVFTVSFDLPQGANQVLPFQLQFTSSDGAVRDALDFNPELWLTQAVVQLSFVLVVVVLAGLGVFLYIRRGKSVERGGLLTLPPDPRVSETGGARYVNAVDVTLPPLPPTNLVDATVPPNLGGVSIRIGNGALVNESFSVLIGFPCSIGRPRDGENNEFRATSSRVCIPGNQSLSREHAVIEAKSDGTLWVRNESQASTTLVGGRPVALKDSVQVRPGDTIDLGGTRLEVDFSTLASGGAKISGAVDPTEITIP